MSVLILNVLILLYFSLRFLIEKKRRNENGNPKGSELVGHLLRLRERVVTSLES